MRSTSERFTVDHVRSPVGTLHVVCDAGGRVRALDFEEYEARMARLLRLHHRPAGYTLVPGRVPERVTGALEAYFAGELSALDGIAVEMGGTAFQRRVWSALRAIPAGTTTSYGRLAAAVGRPDACRAVGLANGANSVVLVLPCHRVIGADGGLTGYGGGLARKRWLLEHEARWATPPRRASGGRRA